MNIRSIMPIAVSPGGKNNKRPSFEAILIPKTAINTIKKAEAEGDFFSLNNLHILADDGHFFLCRDRSQLGLTPVQALRKIVLDVLSDSDIKKVIGDNEVLLSKDDVYLVIISGKGRVSDGNMFPKLENIIHNAQPKTPKDVENGIELLKKAKSFLG